MASHLHRWDDEDMELTDEDRYLLAVWGRCEWCWAPRNVLTEQTADGGTSLRMACTREDEHREFSFERPSL
jgi:hypothetical protein